MSQSVDGGTPIRPHISVSQLSLLRKCGIAYERRYINGEKIPPGIAAHIGTGVHSGANINYAQKIETRTDLPVSDIVDASVSAMKDAVDVNGVVLDPGVSHDIQIGNAIDLTASLATYHAVHVSKRHQPVMTEQRFTIPLPGGKDLLGIIDLVAEQGENGHKLVDLKTTRKAKSQREADTSLQLTAYSLGAKRLTGDLPKLIQLEVLVHSEKGVREQVFDTQRGPEDFKILAAHLNAAEKVIRSGAFTPAAEGSWYCSVRWCGYASTCPFFKGDADGTV